MVTPQVGGVTPSTGGAVRVNDNAIASGNAFLIGELEKRDPKVREPLTSFTYSRDVPIRVGGGWVTEASALNVDYAVAGGSADGLVQAGGANAVPVIQANLNKDKFAAHIYSVIMRIPFIDMQRQAITGRSLERMLTKGVRLSYDKHLDANTYIGMRDYGSTGLLNNPNVIASPAATGTSGLTEFKNKSEREILRDINDAIYAGWENSEFDLSALPNHVLMPYEQFNYISTEPSSELMVGTILDFLLKANVTTTNGQQLVIAGTQYCKGTGAGGTDRMVAYRHDEDYMVMEEFVSLSRTMTSPNTDKLSYDSVYMANVSEVEIFYTQPISYVDGI
jgi:hypothetical protein